MATGRELEGVLPKKAEYDCVTKSIKRVLKDIFDENATLEKVTLVK